jgi:hypothetical protein
MAGRLFNSARHRLARARKHIRDLDRAMNLWVQKNPYAVITEPDPDGAHEQHKIKLKRPPPVLFNHITADALYNLRAALDHAAFAIARTQTDTGLDKVYFPICRNAKSFKEAMKEGEHFFPPTIWAFIDALKPYRGGNELLWTLNKVCNINKHREVTEIGINPYSFRMEGHLPGGHMPPTPQWDTIGNEMVIAITPRDPKVKCKVHLQFLIVFKKTAAATPNEDVLAFLEDAAGIVHRIISGMKAEAVHLGLH